MLRRKAGPPAEMKKADGPCRAIEIVVVMRLTTSSARLESNFQNHDRSRWTFGIDDQKPVIVRNLNQLLAARHASGRGHGPVCRHAPGVSSSGGNQTEKAAGCQNGI